MAELLAHDVAGDGPILLVIHGITENRQFWDGVDLSGYRAIRVDLPGHGESARDGDYEFHSVAGKIARVVESVAPGEAPWVLGHSLGGVVATTYASDHPVAGVLIVDQALQVEGLSAVLRSSEAELTGAGFPAYMDAMFEHFYGELPAEIADGLRGRRSVEQPVVLGYWEPLLHGDAAQLGQWVGSITNIPFDIPYLSLHGFDPGADYATWLRERVPQAVVEVASVATHYPHLADPAAFQARLRAFTGSDR